MNSYISSLKGSLVLYLLTRQYCSDRIFDKQQPVPIVLTSLANALYLYVKVMHCQYDFKQKLRRITTWSSVPAS